MKRWIALVFVLACGFAVAGPGDDHSHDAPPTSSGSTALEAELQLKVLNPQGKPVTGINDRVRVELLEEGKSVRKATSHAEEEPGVYHVDQTFEHEGDYKSIWTLPAGGKDVTAGFDILVGHDEPAPNGGTPTWMIVAGGALGLLVAFFIGRSTGKGRSAGAATMAALLLLGTTPLSIASGEEDGHDHGGGAAAAEPLLIGIGKLGALSQTKEVEGYRLTLTLVVLPPNPSLVRVTDEQRELLGLQVETLGRASFGKGITATGEVQADPARVASLSAPAAGRVESVTATLGQRVRKGETLAVVNAPEAAGAQADVATAQAVLIQSQANVQRAASALALSRQNLKRQEEFAKAGAFSQPTLQAARNELASAESELAEAQSTLRQAKSESATHARELERILRLYEDKLASRRELEAAQLEASLDVERIAQAEARVTQAQTRSKNGREAVQREERIQKEGLYNRREIEAAKAEVTRAEGELRASQTEVKGAQSTVAAARARVGAYGGSGRISIVSPISGTVVKRLVNQGEAVELGRPLIEVLDTSLLWVEVDLFESDIKRVDVGMPVEVRTDSDDSRVLRGSIGTIGRVFDPEKRTAAVRIKVSNPDGSLRQNEFARALIITDVVGESLSVPESSIQEIGGIKVVFVETPQGFRRVDVKLGAGANGRVEILEGLKPGDRVATQGSYQLRMMAASQ